MVTKYKIILFALIICIFAALFICCNYKSNECSESTEAIESSSVDETVEIAASTEQTETQTSETIETSANETDVNVEVDNTNVDNTNVDNTNIDTNVNTNVDANSNTNLVSLGEFLLTAYCPCSSCCGQWAGGATASGVMPVANHTIAVDTSVISFGTEVVINGITYVAEDTGGAINGNRIDVYFDNHQEALNFGVQYAEVFLVKN